MEKQQKLRPVVAGALRLAAGNTLRVANVASVTAAHTNTNARIFACSYIHTNIHTSPSETKNAKACLPLKGKEVTSRGRVVDFKRKYKSEILTYKHTKEYLHISQETLN